MKPVVAILGTGRMGSAAARRLARLGYPLVLWNRTREKAEALAGEVGGRVAGTPFDAVQEARFVLLFLADDDAIYQVMSGFHRMDGAIVVNHSTITPQTGRTLQRFVEGLGGCHVEAPIVAGPRALEEGRGILIVAGRPECIAQARGLLEDLAPTHIPVGADAAAADSLKLAYNALLITTVEAVAESLRLAEEYGVPVEAYKDLLSKTVFASIQEKYVDRMRGDPSGPASFTLTLAAKDLDYALRAAAPQRLPMPAVAGTLTSYRYAVRMGLGTADYTRVYHALKGKEDG